MVPVSVIITAFKEEKTISKAISSLLPQLTPNDQLIVIAPDQSTLSTAQKTSARVKVIQDEGKGKPSALNQAVKQAKGEVLVLTDGDVYVSRNSLKPLLSSLKNQKIGIVSGRPVPLNPSNSLYGFWAYLATQTAHLQRQKRVQRCLPVDCSGYLLALRKNLFQPLPQNTLADDALITQNIIKQGYKTAYSPQALVYVNYPTNLKDWFNQKIRSVGGASLGLSSEVAGWTPRTVRQKTKMRGFIQELGQIFITLSLVKNPSQLFYWFLALLFRTYLWLRIFIKLKLQKPTLNNLWTRIESTK